MGSQFLEIKDNPINLFSISHLKKEFQGLKKDLIKLNREWRDVQKLTYLACYLLRRCQNEHGKTGEDILNSLDVLVKDFSFHFSITYKLLEEINKKIKDEQIQNFFIQFSKKFESKVQVFNNEVVKHKERSNFRDPLVTIFTFPFFLKINTKQKTKKGIKKETFTLEPFSDAKKIEDHLLELKKLLRNKIYGFLEIAIITIPLGILQYLLSIWIKSRIENSIKHEYDKLVEEYKYNIEVRKQAARVSEYLALARRLNKKSSVSDYERANQLSWELAMWLPSNIYKNMVKAIASPDGETNELTVVIAVRKLLLKSKAGDLIADNIAHHAPGIRESQS